MSLTLEQARARARTVSDVTYEVHLELTRDDGFAATTTVTFRASAGGSTFLDLQRAQEVEVVLNGRELDPACYRDDVVHLDGLQEDNAAVVTARMPYVTDGDGMHRFVDPADGAVYAGCFGGMDVNRRVFACFDQPDLKAPFTVSVTARAGDTVLANGIPLESPDPATGGRWEFATTPPLSTYLVTVCVGPWASRTWEHDGRPFGWHARASLAADLDRDLPLLREQTVAAYDYYAGRFEEPYPFDSYDQVFVPGHNWGAMETPGCVSYRDELLPAGRTPEVLARQRAMTVAHEMAHMWFGDLVTFRWWEDTWLNESFADYMGFLVGGIALPGENALAEFDISRKAGGYAADARPTTHPVAPSPEDVPDVDSAFNNFDAISYAKGNSCLRQLAFWLGEETFLAGVNVHLGAHRFGTATLADFVGSLQSVTDRDVAGWVEAWLRTTGHDTLEVERDGSGTVRLRRHGMRPHRVRVHGYLFESEGLVQAWEQVVDLDDDAPVELPAADLVVPNSTGDTFARVVLDDASRDVVRRALHHVPDEHPRVLLWATMLDEAARAELPPEELVALVEEHLPHERAAVAVTHVLHRAVGIVAAVAAPGEVAGLYDRLAATALRILHGEDDRPAVVESATMVLLLTTHDHDLLRGWLEDGTPRGPLTQAQRWQALVRLSMLGAGAVDTLVAAELERDPSSVGQLAAMSARAAAPDPAAKQAAIERFAAEGTSNRELTALARGLWSPEQRELVDGLVAAYLEVMVPVARRGQALGLVVGRAAPAFRWTPEQLDRLEDVIGGSTDLPPVLARTWADVLHDQRLLG